MYEVLLGADSLDAVVARSRSYFWPGMIDDVSSPPGMITSSDHCQRLDITIIGLEHFAHLPDILGSASGFLLEHDFFLQLQRHQIVSSPGFREIRGPGNTPRDD